MLSTGIEPVPPPSEGGIVSIQLRERSIHSIIFRLFCKKNGIKEKKAHICNIFFYYPNKVFGIMKFANIKSALLNNMYGYP